MPSGQQTTCPTQAPACRRVEARPRWRRSGLAVLRGTFAVSLLVAACAAAPGSPRASLGEGGSNGALTTPPSFRAGGPSRATALDADPLWQRAGRGDVIDLTRLADREGAAGLLEGVALGGSIGLTALSALPHAEDAEIALGPLCSLAERMLPEHAGPVLSAVEGILRRPVRPTERLDAEGLLACRAGLPRLETSTKLSPIDRDRLGTSRALLEEWLNAR
jgi:hypothetical protein